MAHDWCVVSSRRKYVVLGLVALVIVGMVCLFMFGREREPEYGGMRLSEWVDLIWQPLPKGIRDERAYSFRRFDESPIAIRSMGTNALPYLLKMRSYEAATWQKKLYPMINRWLGRVNSNWRINFKEPRAYYRAQAANYALFMLLDDPDSERSALVTNALIKLDPQILEIARKKEEENRVLRKASARAGE